MMIWGIGMTGVEGPDSLTILVRVRISKQIVICRKGIFSHSRQRALK